MNKTFLTFNLTEKEGFGAVFQRVLDAYAICRHLGCRYLFTPLNGIAHATDFAGGQSQCDQEWNQYILKNLLPDDIVCDPPVPVKEFINLPGDLSLIRSRVLEPCSETRVFQISEHVKTQNEQEFISQYENIRNDLTSHYRASRYLASYFDPREKNIAIHVRTFTKSDDPDARTLDRELYLRNNDIDLFYCSLINNLSLALKNTPACFHIYSETGLESELNEYDHFKDFVSKPHRILLHIDESPIITLHHMILADILVLAKSSFSYSAHFYSTGVNLMRNGFWHILLPRVQLIPDDGSIDPKILKG